MIGAQVVDLFPEDGRPEFLANEFHGVEFRGDSGHFLGHSLHQPVPHAVADHLQLRRRVQLQKYF